LFYVMTYLLPIPKSPETFEDLVCDLANALHQTTHFKKYGRKGQLQSGIDIISHADKIYIQCKLKTIDLSKKGAKFQFIQSVFKDISAIIRIDHTPEKIIIAATVANDTLIQNRINTIMLMNGVPFSVELWDWEFINNNIFLYPNILNKYFPFRKQYIELANIAVLNKSVYKKSKEFDHVYYYHDRKNSNQLPVFDFSFINNTENTVLLQAVDCLALLQPIAKAGIYPKPSGILKITRKYVLDIKYGFREEYEVNPLDMPDPIFVAPKGVMRIQIQFTKAIVNYSKFKFAFLFNDTTITSPEILFNAREVGGGILAGIEE